MTACLVCCAAIACGAALQAQGTPASRRDPVIDALVADASAGPPEFAADALIRLSASSKISNATRRQLLNEAFLRAYAAREPYRRSSTQIIPPDSRQGAQLFAFDTGLTRVSLQVRAVQVMASVDPARARELFEWIELNLAPGTCEDPLVPAVDEYYAALSTLARTGFGSDRGEAVRFLELYLWQAHLPSEMPAVARAIERFRPRPDEAAYLEGVFRLILEGSSSDARGFSSSVSDIIERSVDLQVEHRKIGVPGWYVLEALRAYLTRQLKAPRCGDSASETMTPSSFNGVLQVLRADLDVKPLDPSVVQPSRTLAAARIDSYWQAPDARRLHEGAMQLYGPGKAPVSIKIRQTDEWRNQAERLLIDLQQWSGTREPAERDYFYQKSLLFAGLIDLIPPRSAVRTRALRAFIEFMRHSDVDREGRPLWFAFLNRLLEMSRGADVREFLAALENSHHPTLALYARLAGEAAHR